VLYCFETENFKKNILCSNQTYPACYEANIQLLIGDVFTDSVCEKPDHEVTHFVPITAVNRNSDTGIPPVFVNMILWVIPAYLEIMPSSVIISLFPENKTASYREMRAIPRAQMT
jgi:hypothetical protein